MTVKFIEKKLTNEESLKIIASKYLEDFSQFQMPWWSQLNLIISSGLGLNLHKYGPKPNSSWACERPLTDVNPILEKNSIIFGKLIR